MLYDNMGVRRPTYFRKPDWTMNYTTIITLSDKPEMKNGYMVDIEGLTRLLESDYF